MFSPTNPFIYARKLYRLEAYSRLGLSLHGAVLLASQGGEAWQWILVGMTAITGVMGLVSPFRRRTLPRLARIFFVLVAGWFLMRASGGPGSFFFLWYIVMAVTTSLAMRPPYNWALLGVIAVAYLALWPATSASAVPPLVILIRTFLLLFLGGLSAWGGTLLRVQAEHGPLSPRTHSLLTALGRLSAQLQAAPDLKRLYAILGRELKRLGVICFVSLSGEEEGVFRLEYLSIAPGLLAMAEKLLGFRVEKLVLSSENFPLTEALVKTKQPQVITEPFSIVRQVLYAAPPGLVKQALRMVGLAEDAFLIYLPLVVEDRLIGTLALWGESLAEADLPVLTLFADQLAAALHMNTLYGRLHALREEEQKSQLRFSQQLIVARGRQAVIDLAAQTTHQALGADLVSIMQLDLMGQHLVLRGGVGWDPKLYGQYRVKITDSREGHAFRTGKTVQQEDVLSGKPFPCSVELAAHGVASSMAAPLVGQERTLGTLCVHSKRRRRFSPAEVRLLTALAAQTALALERAAHVENLERLYRLALDLSQAEEQSEVAALVSEAAAHAFEVPYALLARFDPQTKMVQGVPPAFGIDDDQARAFAYLGVFVESESLWDVTNQSNMMINDLSAAPKLVNELAAPYEVQSALAVRILPKEAPFGLLLMGHPQKDHFSPQAVRQAEAYGQLAALALERIAISEEERTSRRALERLLQATLALNQSLDLGVVLDRILAELQKVIPYDSASVQLLHDDHSLEIIAGRGFDDLDAIVGLRFDIRNDNPNRRVIEARATQIERDVQHRYPAFGEGAYAAARIRAWMGIPLFVRERLIGMIAINSRTPAYFQPEHVPLAEAFAAQAAVAVENARLYEQSRRQIRELEVLHNLSQAVREIETEAELFSHAVRWIGESFFPENFGVLLLDEEGGGLRPQDPYIGADAETLAIVIPLGKGVTGQVALTGKSLRLGDVSQSPYYLAVNEGMRSEVCVPLVVGGKVIGVLNAESKQANAFTQEDERLLNTLAGQLATALVYFRTKRVEQASQARLQAVLDSAPDGIVIVNQAQQIVSLTPAAERIFGYAVEEVIGQPLMVLFPKRFAEAHVGHVERFARSDEVSRLMGERQGMEIVGRRKDGSAFPAEVSISRFKTDEGVFFTAIVRDITERHEAAAERRRLFSAMQQTTDGVLIANREGVIEYVNPAMVEISGYAEEELLGANPRIFKSGLHPEEEYARLWETILRGEVYRTRFANLRKDGRRIYVDQTITPVTNLQGEITHFVSTWKDITEQVAREQQVAEHARRMTELAVVGEKLARPYTEEEVLAAIGEGASRLCGAPGVVVYVRTPEDGVLCAWSSGVSEHYLASVIADFESMPGARLRTTTDPLLIEDVAALPVQSPLRSLALGEGIRSIGLWPLVYEGKTIAAVGCYRPKAYRCDEAEREMMEAFSRQAAIALVNARSYERAQRRLERLSSLHAIDLAITATLGLNTVMETVLTELRQRLGVDAAAVLLWNEADGVLEFAAGKGFKTDALQHTRLEWGMGHGGRAAAEKQLVRVPDLNERPGEFVRAPLLKGEDFVTYLGTPMITQDKVVGVLELFHRRDFEPDAEWIEFLEMLASQAAIAVDNATLFYNMRQARRSLEEAYEKTLEGWVQALDLRDDETENHTRRVTEMTLRLARQMGFEGEALEHIRRGALLHDIGKMGVPDDILLKPGKLTKEEWETMCQHPVYAHQFLSPIEYLRPALNIPYCHHERWDGSGYPRGLKGEEIPMEARIFAVVDVWDALLSDRPYRKAWPPERVRAYLKEQAGKMFDPLIVEMFLSLLDETGA